MADILRPFLFHSLNFDHPSRMIVLMVLLVFHSFFILFFHFHTCCDNLHNGQSQPHSQWIWLLQIYSLYIPVISYSDFTSYFPEKIEDRVSSLFPNQRSYLIFSASLVYKYAHRQIPVESRGIPFVFSLPYPKLKSCHRAPRLLQKPLLLSLSQNFFSLPFLLTLRQYIILQHRCHSLNSKTLQTSHGLKDKFKCLHIGFESPLFHIDSLYIWLHCTPHSEKTPKYNSISMSFLTLFSLSKVVSILLFSI